MSLAVNFACSVSGAGIKIVADQEMTGLSVDQSTLATNAGERVLVVATCRDRLFSVSRSHTYTLFCFRLRWNGVSNCYEKSQDGLVSVDASGAQAARVMWLGDKSGVEDRIEFSINPKRATNQGSNAVITATWGDQSASIAVTLRSKVVTGTMSDTGNVVSRGQFLGMRWASFSVTCGCKQCRAARGSSEAPLLRRKADPAAADERRGPQSAASADAVEGLCQLALPDPLDTVYATAKRAEVSIAAAVSAIEAARSCSALEGLAGAAERVRELCAAASKAAASLSTEADGMLRSRMRTE
jgi:hypothetical protein